MRCRKFLFAVLLSLIIGPAGAAQVYLEPENFLAQAFQGEVPSPRKLWLTGEIGEGLERILGHPPHQLRQRYWKQGNRTAWILEEIGKTEPITTGLVVENGRIERIRVLIYRESRGYEVRYPFFTQQFEQVQLTDNNRLSRQIDGITGATLSVNALKNLSRAALFLHRQVTGEDDETQ